MHGPNSRIVDDKIDDGNAKSTVPSSSFGIGDLVRAELARAVDDDGRAVAKARIGTSRELFGRFGEQGPRCADMAEHELDRAVGRIAATARCRQHDEDDQPARRRLRVIMTLRSRSVSSE